MLNNKVIALLSDFGLSDIYVAVMKGVIAQVNPALTLIDLTHQIPPQNIAAGRFCLMSAYRYFPDGTVYLAVVDPGVGSNRRAIAVQFSQGFLIGPDNGLFSGILSQSPAIASVELSNDRYWRNLEPSNTFHGRDIFAPVAAHLASGVPIQQLGQVIDPNTLVQLPIAECTQTDTGLLGCIQYIDHFGNLITNIPGSLVQGKSWFVKLAEINIIGNNTYSNTAIGDPITLVSSEGWVEIAINSGNAQSRLGLNWRDIVEIVFS